MNQKDSINFYTDQIKQAKRSVSHFEKLINTYSFLRLFVIAAVLAAIYKSVQAESVILTEVSILGGVIAFAFLVSKQAGFEKKKAFHLNLKIVNENEVESVLNQKNIYNQGLEFIDDTHVYTSDLDIFGNASLYNLLNRCATVAGNKKLSSWLKERTSTSEILLRQDSVKELASKKEWMQDFKAKLIFAKEDKMNEVSKLLNYLGTPLETFNPALKRYISITPFATTALVVGAYFYPLLTTPAILLGLINMALVFFNAAKVNRADQFVGKAGKVLYHYAEAFQKIEEEDFHSGYIKSLSLKANEEKVFHKRFKELSILAGKLEYRLNIFIGPVLNFLLAWDLRQMIALERWKQENRESVENVFDDLATVESLVSLASLHLNYPAWSFPSIDAEDGYTFSARDLGHPLLDESKRVLNDFQLTDEFKIDIITGSNMAGKSTFLRTLGINGVLALAGAPVCAREMSVSNMLIFTYMRIKDSLNESTSTFKAELDRLKLLLETLNNDSKVYFLIDEMLRGTNSVDKYLGSKAIIERLISEKAVGIVATHDLQIARLEDKYPNYIRNFYFDIQVRGKEMLFDYKIKPGECKTFNASILLKQLGIRFEEEEI
ncbi:MutS-related protein [Desertivirga brevis]|uniref:MutS-related protein n=1 Tax=Desertivirga brevis TaxID=2810310 RepID=UPI001A961BB2|nr:DNA mismatch repair protein MutS [Pedobacter sp. SYSU D00873]